MTIRTKPKRPATAPSTVHATDLDGLATLLIGELTVIVERDHPRLCRQGLAVPVMLVGIMVRATAQLAARARMPIGTLRFGVTSEYSRALKLYGPKARWS